MDTKPRWRWLSLFVLAIMLVPLAPGFSGAQEPAAPPAPHATDVSEPKPFAPISPDQYLEKLHPDLRALALKAGPSLPEGTGDVVGAVADDPIPISVIAQVSERAEQADELVSRMQPFFVAGQLYAEPPLGGMVILTGKVRPSDLAKLASMADVLRINPITKMRNEPEPYPADDPRAEYSPGPEEWAALQANAAQLREGSMPWQQAKAFGDGRDLVRPDDWFEVLPEGPHKAKAAWDRGYMGEGVAVAVIDDGVDFAHPDLMGTQKIYSSTANPQYNGWPMIMDPFSMRAYYYELTGMGTDVSDGFPGVTYIDTSHTPAVSACAPGLSCFSFTPLIDTATPGFTHTYVFSSSMSQSGVVHVGTHHDESLRDYVWGERVAVMVCDPNAAGVYDTVYVDLDNDYNFRDEKPLTKADVHNLANTQNNMVAYRDMSIPPDGKADLSGGILYWIADGAHHVPGMDRLFQLTNQAIAPPGNGDLICMHGPWDSGYSHGTNCASNVVGQGVAAGMLPQFRDLGPATPPAAVYGMAPEAGLVAMNTAWGFSGRITYRDAYYLAAYGWDEISQDGELLGVGHGYIDTDPIQATSNSYGWSGDFNDGWDFLGQVVVDIQTRHAPWLQFLFSTGNGGPGYGTVAPPSPATGIAVGASTQYGSTGWGTITNTTQINFNDVAAFSNSGPGARDGAGVDVVAGGAFAAGSEELNYYSMGMYGLLDGNVSWDAWGGTSRSSPVALGIYALMAQAYKDKHGVWPTHQQGKALMMSGASDINYDVYKQGAGSVNGDRVTSVASGEYGVYMDADSATWQPGDFRGSYYPYFAHLVYPNDTWNKIFTVVNDGPAAINVNISDAYLQRMGSEEFSFDVTAGMVEAENADNFYKAFHYFIPLTATAGMDPSMYHIPIPPDTELMVVRQIHPFGTFDPDGDYSWDNRFYLTVYNWTDQDGDGRVWDDKDGNDVVNFVNGPYLGTAGLKASPELAWDDPITELDRWEYARFDYNRPSGNAAELCVQDPLHRMGDGLFIGLRHHPGSSFAGDTTLEYRVEFYKRADTPWLSTDVTSLSIPAGGTSTFQGTVNVPADMPPGDYAAAIRVQDPGLVGGRTHNIIIPVALNVAASYTDGLTLGGRTAYEYDENAGNNYNNGAVRGYFDWGWREESGDWRFFCVDIDNDPVEIPIFPMESFDSGIPGTWTVVDNDGSGMVWQNGAGCGYINETGGSGEFADANSDCYGPSSYDTELRTPAIDLSTASHPLLEFKSAYENYGGNDSARVWASSDGGSNWDLLLEWNNDQSGPRTIQLPLTAYAGNPNVIISFQYDSNGTVGWYWYWQVDDVRVFEGVRPYDPTGHVLVRDEWDDAAPQTDIDTVVLGPAPTSLAAYDFGAWATNGSNPGLFGPYVLETVASSVDDRAGRSIWRFNTTSGANEEWVSFDLGGGGLHEILQHNVLFQGDQFDVVFTKTLGMLFEDPHSFAISTTTDQGTVGTLTVSSTIDLNGLVVDSFFKDVDEQIWMNEPLAFAGSGTIEWTYEFEVQDGLSIELATSSPDIADIDLYLFYWTGTGWEQRAISGGIDANEYIFLTDPDDGTWMIGVNNYSGPAGQFHIFKWVESRAPGLTVTGVPTGPIPANTDVQLTIHYDKEMQGGVTYAGKVVLGPPEAPGLKEVPVSITRTGPYFASSYKDGPDTVPTDGTIIYDVFLTNSGDQLADVTFTDPIPAGTTFAWLVTPPSPFVYNPLQDRVEWTGHVAPGDTIILHFAVTADPGMMYQTVLNTATIAWDGNTVDLLHATLVLPGYHVFLPVITTTSGGP